MSDRNPIAAAIRAGVWADPVTSCGPRHDAPRDGSCPCGAVSRHPAATPAQAGDEAIVAALAEALDRAGSFDTEVNTILATALLPTVRRIAEQRAAEERAELADAARLLNELAEDTDAIPCRYDHHGECQEHSGGERCYDRDAHEFLKSVGVR